MVNHTQRVRLLIGVVVVIVLVIWAALSVASGARAGGTAGRVAGATPGSGQPAGPPSPLGTPVHPYPDGVPMVHVRSTQGPGPNFGAADVASALQTYRMSYQQPGTPALQVTGFECVSSAQLSQRLNLHIGRPPTALVCLVDVTGDFMLPGRTSSSPAVIVHHGQLVIDAVTGNVLTEIVLFT